MSKLILSDSVRGSGSTSLSVPCATESAAALEPTNHSHLKFVRSLDFDVLDGLAARAAADRVRPHFSRGSDPNTSVARVRLRIRAWAHTHAHRRTNFQPTVAELWNWGTRTNFQPTVAELWNWGTGVLSHQI